MSVISYSICSGTLVLINKLTLRQMPYPALVAVLQLLATLAFIGSGRALRYIRVDPVRWKYVKPYLYYVLAFSIGVYCNMRSLAASKVETIIVFRALSPCIVAVLDAMFLGREYPTKRSWFALSLLVVGAWRYASHNDDEFHNQKFYAYLWPFLYLCIISFQMFYGKFLIGSVELRTRSGPVLYTNMLALLPMFLLATFDDEYSRFKSDRAEGKPITTLAILLLLLGCCAGTGIGYSSWWCRDKISATSFTVTGVINKTLTILLNLSPRDANNPHVGLFSLGLCLVGGYLYSQAPLRSVASSRLVASAADEVWEEDLSIAEEDKDEVEQLMSSSDSDLSKRRV